MISLAAWLLLMAAGAQNPPPPPAPQNPSPMIDTTRAHPRIPKTEVEGTRLALSLGGLYLQPKLSPRVAQPLVVHFHGAPWLVEYHASRHLPGAVLLTVHLGAGSGIYARAFAEKGRFGDLLEEARSRVREKHGRNVEWRSVTVSAFSAGYGAVRAILGEPESYAQIDALLLADGLHTSYLPAGAPGPLDEQSLDVFVRFARDALRGSKVFRLTHSEVFPGTFASTTETADHLLARLGKQRKAVLRWGPAGMQQLSEAGGGGFRVSGFAGNSAPDHMDHLYALGAWLRELQRALR